MFVPDTIIPTSSRQPKWHISTSPLLLSFTENKIAITDLEQYLDSLLLQQALFEGLYEISNIQLL